MAWSTSQVHALGKRFRLDILRGKSQVANKEIWTSVTETISAVYDGSLTASLGLVVLFFVSTDESWTLWFGEKAAVADEIRQELEEDCFLIKILMLNAPRSVAG